MTKISRRVFGTIAAGSAAGLALGWYGADKFSSDAERAASPTQLERTAEQAPQQPIQPQKSPEELREEQLNELSDLVSKSTGVPHNFEFGNWNGKPLGNFRVGPYTSIYNNNPDQMVHKFLFDKTGTMFLGHIREIRDARYLVNYPSDSAATVIPNPAFGNKDLVTVVWDIYDTPIRDLRQLAELANAPITASSQDYFVARRRRQWDNKDGKRVAAPNPGVLEPDGRELHYVSVSESTDNNGERILKIWYNKYEAGNNEGRYSQDSRLGRHTFRRFTPKELLSFPRTEEMRKYDEDGKILREEVIQFAKYNNGFIDNVLTEQELRLVGGKWQATKLVYDSTYPSLIFVRENGVMKLANFITGP